MDWLKRWLVATVENDAEGDLGENISRSLKKSFFKPEKKHNRCMKLETRCASIRNYYYMGRVCFNWRIALYGTGVLQLENTTIIRAGVLQLETTVIWGGCASIGEYYYMGQVCFNWKYNYMKPHVLQLENRGTGCALIGDKKLC